jgi:hypothetical protein
MGEIIRFVPKSERERARLIREARGVYDNIFPPVHPVGEQNKTPGSNAVSASAPLSGGGPLS